MRASSPIDERSTPLLVSSRNRTRRLRHCYRDVQCRCVSRCFRCSDDDEDAVAAAVVAATATAVVAAVDLGAASCCASDDGGARRATSPSLSDNHYDDAWSPLTTVAPSGCASALLDTLVSRGVRLLPFPADAMILIW